ncbi:MAG: pyruvate dehydrogenase (acetyl-transferring) E1 component subunit alpha [Holosporales bacterium]|jgi:pyruvate dehydrogenase E1 component alpha subunit|nr:pyruvate dehydrogenase (acetyl-transferring) E1 component subunit alpha [Holosporales bacterium]
MNQETLLKLYQQMLTIRLFEEKVAELYTQGYIYGFCHLYIGQEACVVGVTTNMQPQDSVITSYRDHAHMLTLGVSPNSIMAELCGRSTGCSGGKGGSMHMYSKSHNFYGGNGIVGAQVSIGTGLALSHKYKNDDGIAFIYYGDGAANQGQVFESFNMASLWKLPALYIVENNHYAMGTNETRAVAGNLLSRGDSFKIKTFQADGMNLFEVIEKSSTAVEYVRSGKGPAILHLDTYRYRGHSMSDPTTYRSRTEVDEVKKVRDPIMQVRKNIMNEPALDKIDEEVSAIIATAAKFALESPEPDISELETNVVA